MFPKCFCIFIILSSSFEFSVTCFSCVFSLLPLPPIPARRRPHISLIQVRLSRHLRPTTCRYLIQEKNCVNATDLKFHSKKQQLIFQSLNSPKWLGWEGTKLDLYVFLTCQRFVSSFDTYVSFRRQSHKKTRAEKSAGEFPDPKVLAKNVPQNA